MSESIRINSISTYKETMSKAKLRLVLCASNVDLSLAISPLPTATHRTPFCSLDPVWDTMHALMSPITRAQLARMPVNCSRSLGSIVDCDCSASSLSSSSVVCRPQISLEMLSMSSLDSRTSRMKALRVSVTVAKVDSKAMELAVIDLSLVSRPLGCRSEHCATRREEFANMA